MSPDPTLEQEKRAAVQGMGGDEGGSVHISTDDMVRRSATRSGLPFGAKASLFFTNARLNAGKCQEPLQPLILSEIYSCIPVNGAHANVFSEIESVVGCGQPAHCIETCAMEIYVLHAASGDDNPW